MTNDQRYALQAAAAAAVYAKKQARDEARKALVISTALNQNLSLDPKLQQQLGRLIEKEANRVEQENFDWWASMVIGGALLVGLLLLFMLPFCTMHSSVSAYVEPQATPKATATPEATPTPIEVRRGELVKRPTTAVSLTQAEQELQKTWDALPASKQAALRAEEREWIRKKDKATGAAKLRLIQERTAYLLNQS